MSLSSGGGGGGNIMAGVSTMYAPPSYSDSIRMWNFAGVFNYMCKSLEHCFVEGSLVTQPGGESEFSYWSPYFWVLIYTTTGDGGTLHVSHELRDIIW